MQGRCTPGSGPASRPPQGAAAPWLSQLPAWRWRSAIHAHALPSNSRLLQGHSDRCAMLTCNRSPQAHEASQTMLPLTQVAPSCRQGRTVDVRTAGSRLPALLSARRSLSLRARGSSPAELWAMAAWKALAREGTLPWGDLLRMGSACAHSVTWLVQLHTMQPAARTAAMGLVTLSHSPWLHHSQASSYKGVLGGQALSPSPG